MYFIGDIECNGIPNFSEIFERSCCIMVQMVSYGDHSEKWSDCEYLIF